MDKIADRIYELIAGKLNNELMKEEQKELDELMDQSLEYQILFENIKKAYVLNIVLCEE